MEYGGDFAFSGIAYRLFHSIVDVEPFNAFTFDMYSGKIAKVRRIPRIAAILSGTPYIFKAVFFAENLREALFSDLALTFAIYCHSLPPTVHTSS